jgi:SAM-dependent methyltransferase
MVFKQFYAKLHRKLGYDNTLIPPVERIFVGIADIADFKKHGQVYLETFIEEVQLQPHEIILEVGCGIGRIAAPLTQYLTSGHYEGFDIVPHGIEWCQQKITPKYPNFNFQLADLYNKFYNPTGSQRAEHYQFPYSQETFDFVFLASVFTHMMPTDVAHYLKEINRVLKNGGRCLMSFFLLNSETIEALNDPRRIGKLKFEHDYGDYRLENPNEAESAIAYEETFVRNLYQKNELKIIKIRYGTWRNYQKNPVAKGQDIVVALKNNNIRKY